MSAARRKSVSRRKEFDNGEFIAPENSQGGSQGGSGGGGFGGNNEGHTVVAQAVVLDKWEDDAKGKEKHSYTAHSAAGGGEGGGGSVSTKKNGNSITTAGSQKSLNSTSSFSVGGVKKSLLWPVKLRDAVVDSFLREPNEKAAEEFLVQREFPIGLVSAVTKTTKKLPIRFYIIDDSGSMNRVDGRRIIRNEHIVIDSKTHKEKKVVEHVMKQCTRWTELVVTIKFLAELSVKMQCPSEFRLLNGADPVMIGLNSEDDGDAMAFLSEVLAEDPAGSTPLCQQVDAVVAAIKSMEGELREYGQKATVVIATDGEATDGDVTEAMRPLQNLPVWVVIRLCTNEQAVVDYWNNIDKELELEMDVIDDLASDADDIFKLNPWLVYGEPLHRCREFGIYLKDMDLIDEQKLSSDQMRSLVSYLVADGNAFKLPHPDGDFDKFFNEIKRLSLNSPRIFCTVRKAEHSWIDFDKLKKSYGPPSSSACTIS